MSGSRVIGKALRLSACRHLSFLAKWGWGTILPGENSDTMPGLIAEGNLEFFVTEVGKDFCWKGVWPAL
ncbi:MAG: hypothetical protein MK138_17470 [Planctomycetes bacterium]|nr:hypothetical protein [Planctomycetota bacterium]